MPNYEYVCTHCGHEFELVQKMTDPPRKLCPKCRRKVTRKVGSGAGIIFKGSGFYATDYRSPDYKAKEKADKGGSAGAAEKSKPAKESVPAKSEGGTTPK